MALSLKQVMAELDPYYSGSRTLVQNQINAAPAQQQAEETALDAKKTQAYDEILAGARQRGLGFSGIPLGEQAKYAATDYAPALANLKAKYVGQKNTLLEALNSLGREQRSQAYDIFNANRNFDEQKRQFNLTLAEQKAAARRASAAGGGFGGISFPTPTTAPTPTRTTSDPTTARNLTGGKSQQDAYNAVKSLLLTNNAKLISTTLDAIAKSAQYGNTYDLYKLQLLESPNWASQFYKGQLSIPYYGAGKF